MKPTKYIIGLLIGTTLFSCGNFDDINTDPDAASKANSQVLATGAILGITKPSIGKNFVGNQMLSKYMAWGEGREGTQYNSFGRESFSGYNQIKDYELMAELARPEEKAAYEALALFLKAYKLYNYTMNVGDIPYKGILEGAEGNLTPAYNSQKEVFQLLLADLDRAHALFQEAKAFRGDPIFKGNIKNWSKINTALELRVLISLSRKEADTDLKVAAKFAEVVARGSLMESNSDNLQLTFSDKEGQLYPFNNTLHNHSIYTMMSSTVVDILKTNQDYRLFYYANPASTQLKAGVKEDAWEAYIGVDPSMPFTELSEIYESKDYSPINSRYISYIYGEPYSKFNYAEQNFILAEAALRGWFNGDANVYYKKGIEASMRFAADNTPDQSTYHHGRKITADVITATLATASLQLTGSFEPNLKKIIEQKYVAEFMQTPYLSYYDYRRTGYPAFPINPVSNLNSDEPTKMPMRWLYPNSEFEYNKVNVEAAIQKQYAGDDDVNAIMWILQ